MGSEHRGVAGHVPCVLGCREKPLHGYDRGAERRPLHHIELVGALGVVARFVFSSVRIGFVRE
jgi:hypothetical protein